MAEIIRKWRWIIRRRIQCKAVDYNCSECIYHKFEKKENNLVAIYCKLDEWG